MARYWIAFYRGRGRLMDKVIRFASRAPYSHVEMIRQDQRPKDGDVVTCISSSGRDGGVRIKEIQLKPGKWSVYEVPWARAETWDRAEVHLGKPYELWMMVWSQLFKFHRTDRHKWFCSELIAHALGLSMPHGKSPSDLLRAVHDNTQTWHYAIAWQKSLADAQVVVKNPKPGDEDETGSGG